MGRLRYRHWLTHSPTQVNPVDAHAQCFECFGIGSPIPSIRLNERGDLTQADSHYSIWYEHWPCWVQWPPLIGTFVETVQLKNLVKTDGSSSVRPSRIHPRSRSFGVIVSPREFQTGLNSWPHHRQHSVDPILVPLIALVRTGHAIQNCRCPQSPHMAVTAFRHRSYRCYSAPPHPQQNVVEPGQPLSSARTFRSHRWSND